ncbi:hypothetical protein NEFER02_1071, partial [Nematocida sp. LUAm2]
MKELRNKTNVRIIFFVLTSILLFSIVLTTQSISSTNESNNEDQLNSFRIDFTLPSIAQRLTKEEIADKNNFNPDHTVNEQLIKDKDVLYLFIYAQYDCIQFIDAQRKVYSTDSLSFFKLLFEEIQK